jgi:hypothetical protein
MLSQRVKRPVKKRKSNLEDQHQKSLIDWAKVFRLPELPHIEVGAKLADYMFHIPNGGKRGKVEAAILKGMGTKKGVSDLFLPLPMHGKPGLWIEMKAPFKDSKDKNYPSTDQKQWLTRMSLAGYVTAVAYGWFEARQIILNYIGGQHDEIR